MPTQEREETSQPIRERGREGERERGNTTLKQTKRERAKGEREREQTPPNDTREGGEKPPSHHKKERPQPTNTSERKRERERRRGKKPPKQQKRVYRQKGESRHHPANTQEKMGWEKPPNKHT